MENQKDYVPQVLYMGKFTTMIFFLFFLATFFSPSAAGDTIIPTQPLADAQILVSAGGRFALGFFRPNGTKNRYVGIWYNNISAQKVVWVANRRNPITDATGALALTSTGSLVIRAQNNMTVCSTNVTSMRDPVAQLLDNGNFVVRDSSRGVSEGGFAWQSFDHPTDMLLPGMKLGFDLVNGLNRSLTAWTSNSNPSPGSYSLMLDIQNDPQMVLREGSNQLWRSGYWNGHQFSDMPGKPINDLFNFTLVRNQDEVYWMFKIPDSIILHMVVTPSGTIEFLVWVSHAGWSVFWVAPGNQCDAADVCGPYGLCDDNLSPVCSCLQGFVPKEPASWALRDGSEGCVRKVPLDCTGGTDGFVTVNALKLPDVSGLMLDTILSLQECRAICLANCSCTGYASADIRGNGSGCMIWSAELTSLQIVVDGGQDLYVRLAGADLGSMFSNDQWNDDFTEQDLDLPILDLNTIVTATNNFSVENKLGEGGFGPVYKGKLGEGQDVAVKRLAKTSIQGIDEFKNEVVLIAKLQHRNLVRLLGCCIQGEEKILVYEYMPNKSLDSFLFDKTKAALLDWQTRYCIIVGIARGLLYLHQDSRFRIIHRDLKAGNILLDKEMNPKISDFGMARIFGGDEFEASTRRVVGTYGYMSPEYVKDGIFSVKSDVFSYGVLMLEIISGKRNRGNYIPEPHENLLGYAWNFWRDGNGPELVDKSMDCSSSMAKVLRCINVGLLCVQEWPGDRPTMPSVALMLSSDDGQVPHPKKPGFVTAEVTLESNTSSKESYTINEVTVTILDGR